jgi:hypothetical protein
VTTATLDLQDVFTAFLSWDEIAALVHSGDADEPVRRRALDHPEPRVRREAALRLRRWADAMERAARDTNNEVRQVAASSSATPPEALAGLFTDRSRVVRELLARNTHTPPHIVDALAFDTSSQVRLGVAKRTLSTAAMAHLSRDPFGQVREQLAQNPELPDALCISLAGDHSPRVRAIIARRNAPEAVYARLAHDAVREVALALASNRHIPHRVAQVLANHPQRTVRMAIARKTSHPDILDVLADDLELVVRVEVGINPALASSTAVRMLGSASAQLRNIVLRRHHDRLPDELVDRTLDDLLRTPRSADRLELRTTFAHRLRPRVIVSPPAFHDRRALFEVVDYCLPFELIADAIDHPDIPVRVRAGLLDHPLVPPAVRAQLTNHPHPIIRQAARRPRKRYLP